MCIYCYFSTKLSKIQFIDQAAKKLEQIVQRADITDFLGTTAMDTSVLLRCGARSSHDVSAFFINAKRTPTATLLIDSNIKHSEEQSSWGCHNKIFLP